MEYKIIGGSFPAVICSVEAGEKMITESGAMAWMSPNMKMETKGGGLGKALGRMFSGDTIFQNHYTAMQHQGEIAFAASVPGCIIPVQISPGHDLIVQKSAFLASEATVDMSIFFRKKIGTGIFGGEGFIMQRLSGNGTAFIEVDGAVQEYTLSANQSIIVDTGYVTAMDPTCSMDIQSVPGVKNMLLGGEGIFNTVITGPGKVILQTMPLNQLANAISPYIVSSN